jgi:hypothetical protein
MPAIMILFISSLLLIVGAVTVHAWQSDGGELTVGQPAFGNIATAGTTLTYTYNLSDSRAVTLQIIGEVAQPTITILKDGKPVANQPNAEGSKIVSLTALLDAGSYTIQVGAVNNTVGSVIVVVQSATPITTGQLPIASVVSGQVTADIATATYNFTALPEAAFLYFESTVPTGGATVHLKNTAANTESIINGADVSGARFRIPAGSTAYEVDVTFTGTDQPQTFTLCLTTVSASSCEAGSAPQTDTTGDVSAPTPDASNPSACSVTPLNANGANIRKTADTASPVLVGLPNGEVAAVIGISPAGNFYQVSYKNVKGWVSKVAVGTNGDCSGVPVVTPPIFVPTPTPVPPTPIPPTKQPEPTGPCLITITDKMLVYTQPNAIPDYIFDQVQQGYQLTPVGKLQNNSWWKTNYNGSWIETSHFGHEAKVSGNCKGLPVVSP